MRRLPDGPRPRAVDVIACDLDRTLTDARLRTVPSALAALGRVRAAGTRTVLVSGRRPAEIARRPRLADSFDGLVLEGGALVGRPGALHAPRDGRGTLPRLEAWLRARGVPVDGGEAILTVSRAGARVLERFPHLDRVARHPNRGRVDVTDRGVDKGSGLRALLRGPGWPRAPTVVAFGDGENDLALFRAADYRVAVANAVPALRRRADAVTRYPGGRGVADFVRRRLLEEATTP